MLAFYNYVHNSLGLHFWDIPTLVVAVLLLVVILVHNHKQKKREKNFEEERKEKLDALRSEAAEATEP